MLKRDLLELQRSKAEQALAERINALAAAVPTVAEAFPVGSLFVSVSPTNPAASLGYGTWAAFGTGRFLIGVDVADTDFDTVRETGGSKTATF